MKVIHVLRKPCSEPTVAANVLRWGTGGLNIDAGRISALGEILLNHSRSAEAARSKGIYGDSAPTETHQSPGQALGRWPANLILQHLPGCAQDGTRKTRSSGWSDRDSVGAGMGFRGGKGNGGRHYADPDGTETIAAWTCAPGCPVAALDQQSGVTVSTGGRIGNAEGAYSHQGSAGWSGKHAAGDPGYGDKGGVSRYFKQLRRGTDAD